MTDMTTKIVEKYLFECYERLCESCKWLGFGLIIYRSPLVSTNLSRFLDIRPRITFIDFALVSRLRGFDNDGKYFE